MGTTSSHQGLGCTCMLFEPLMATKVKRAITTNLAAFYGLLNIVELHPHKGRLVKRNLCHAVNINFILRNEPILKKKTQKSAFQSRTTTEPRGGRGLFIIQNYSWHPM
jgi:hypothetical protein